MSLGSRYLNQFQYSLEKDTVIIEASFEVDGYGEVTHYQGGGVASIASTGTGAYNITLQDGWDYLFELSGMEVKSTASTVAHVQLMVNPATLQANIKTPSVPLSIVCRDYAGNAVDPSTTGSMRIKILVRRSSVGPFDAGTTV